MSKSVAVTLLGGLGNQMFQYALGRTLSLRLGLPLVLDISMYRNRIAGRIPRQYELDRFRLAGQQVRDQPLLLARLRNRLTRILSFCGIGETQRIEEQGLAFHPQVLQTRGPCQLVGYWQSERYFESISQQLREDFTFLPSPDPRSAPYESRIRQAKSVGLCFRRTDYVSSPTFGTSPEEYYTAALDLVASQLGRDIELFVFSDDIEWCRRNVRYPFATDYVDWEGMDHTGEDMRLMSACQALIMANSTFNWWAGWLNPRPDKVVVAPRQWFRKPGLVSDLPDSPWLIAI
jgi:hypothetical protein